MHDVIVIGAGGMGSATLYHLASSGCNVLGLEQFGIPHAYGSSHGSTRIIRLAYAEGSEYVPLVRSAYRYWQELEEVSGRKLLHITGGLDIGLETSWNVQGSRRSCLLHGLEFEELDGREVNRRFPGYRLPHSMRAVYQRRGGYLLSETAIAAHAEMARRRGAEVLLETKVLGWESGARGVRVRSERGTHEARRLVITAGAWTGGLARSLRRFCRPERQVMLWTEPLGRSEFEPARFPVFVLDAPLGLFYGFPNHDSEGFKIGKFHHLRQGVDDPGKLDRTCRPEDERVLREGIAEYFPRANGPRTKAAACMFTNSPDGDFILDRHPSHDRVFVAAGFSGHGFKFCGVVGKVMAELCLGRDPPWDIRRFRLTPERMDRWRVAGGC